MPQTRTRPLRIALLGAVLLLVGTVGAATNLIVAHQNTADSIIGIAFDRMAELTAEFSGGDLTLEVYHGGTLGQERELIEQTIGGIIDIVIASPGNFGVFEPAANILAFPFLYRDIDHVRRVVDGPVFDLFNQRFIDNLGVRALTTGFPGFRYTYTKDRPVRSIADFSGLRIRVPPSDIHTATFRALGANPTPMAFGEIYTGLQTGVVDGLENINEFIYTPSLHEQLDYATRTNHMFEPWTILMNERRYQSLSSTQRDAIDRAATQAWEEQRAAMAERTEMFHGLLVESGMEFFDIDLEPLMAATAPVRDEFAASIPGGQELLEAIISAGE